MDIRVIKPEQLTPELIERWDTIQTSHVELHSPYFRSEFTQAIAAVRENVEVAIIERQHEPIGFFPFERQGEKHGRPVGGWLSDFHGPIIAPGELIDMPKFMRACRLSSWDFTHLPMTQPSFAPFAYECTISPYLDFTGGFDSYRAGLPSDRNDEFKKRLRLYRKVERECGPVRLEFDVQDDQLLQTLLNLKSAQYHRTGLVDIFAFPWTVALLRKLHAANSADFRGQLSALYFGDQLAALHFGLFSRGVLHYWFPTYIPELNHYSPGILMLMAFAMCSQELGLQRIEIGKGDSYFKTSLASGADMVGEGSVDVRRLSSSVRRSWWQTKRWIKESPLYQPVKLVKHRLLGLDGSRGVR